MAYLLDTSIAIHAGAAHDAVVAKLAQHAGKIFLSALVLAELQRGLHKHPAHRGVRQTQVDLLLQQLPVFAFDAIAAEAYGRIIAQCGWVKGRDFDRMIAAHAISTKSILVTANVADFRDIPALEIENWIAKP